ncbi:MAG: hypothetical protein R6V26_06035 [Roseovarius sp.]
MTPEKLILGDKLLKDLAKRRLATEAIEHEVDAGRIFGLLSFLFQLPHLAVTDNFIEAGLIPSRVKADSRGSPKVAKI